MKKNFFRAKFDRGIFGILNHQSGNLIAYLTTYSNSNLLTMTVCSKYHYCERGKDWKDGGWFQGDFHVWVKNKKTGKIIDPHFAEHHDLCRINGLDITKPVYRPWSNQKQMLHEKLCEYYPCLSMLVKIYAENPRYLCCAQNSLAWIKAKPEREKTHTLVIGSMGWKNKNEPGVWYEWG